MLSVVADEAVRTELHADLDELTRQGAQRMRAPRVDDRRVDPVTRERMRLRSVIL